MQRRYIQLIPWIIGIQAVSALMGFITKNNIPDWYVHLNKSPLTPPGYVFGIVWPILYLMIAIAGWLLWTQPSERSKYLKPLFITQMILNWLWTPVFFHFHFIGIAWAVIGLLLIVLSGLILAADTLTIRLLLTPYWIWSVFACYLNGYTFNS